LKKTLIFLNEGKLKLRSANLVSVDQLPVFRLSARDHPNQCYAVGVDAAGLWSGYARAVNVRLDRVTYTLSPLSQTGAK